MQNGLVAIWLAYNGYETLHYLHSKECDPYPVILLNLRFSPQAAHAAPSGLTSCRSSGATSVSRSSVSVS